MTGMTVETLSAVSGLATTVIAEAEAAATFAEPEVTERLRTIFEARGLAFIGAGEGGGGPGVRMREHAHDEGIRPQNLNAANDG